MILEFKNEYSFLSNFHVVGHQLVTVSLDADGLTKLWMPTVEHAYVVYKVKRWSNFEKMTDLSLQSYRRMTPGQAKRLGQKLNLRPDWEDVRFPAKFPVMRHLIRQKFSPGTPMAARLLDTGNHALIEGNHWHDQTWGWCLCKKHIQDPGLNFLGRFLMEIREEVRHMP